MHPGDSLVYGAAVPTSEARVIEWRADRLFFAGLDPKRAYHYAGLRHPDVARQGYALDVNEFERLVEDGASADEALTLVLPLDCEPIPAEVEGYGLSEAV